MRIKICGITNTEDALNAIALGADALGFILAKNSPRYVSPETIEEIVLNLPPLVNLVGVFVNENMDTINEIAERCQLDLIQLHGQESPEFCMKINRPVIKAIKVAERDDLNTIDQYSGYVKAILLDSKVPNKDGGTGHAFDWGIALEAKKEFDMPIILAGGINSENCQKAIELVNPYAIDLSSGVEESPGKKDYNKLTQVLKSVKTI